MKCFYLLLALVACAAADQCADAGGECAESCGASDDVLVGRSCGTEKICCIAKAEEDDERLQKRDARFSTLHDGGFPFGYSGGFSDRLSHGGAGFGLPHAGSPTRSNIHGFGGYGLVHPFFGGGFTPVHGHGFAGQTHHNPHIHGQTSALGVSTHPHPFTGRTVNDDRCGITPLVERTRNHGRIAVGFSTQADTSYGEFPWHCALLTTDLHGNDIHYICGATLIHPNVVLTAAHCVHDIKQRELNLLVDCGDHNLNSNHDEDYPVARSPVQEIHIFPHYDPGTARYDAALLILQHPAPILQPNVKTACLPLSHSEIFLRGVEESPADGPPGLYGQSEHPVCYVPGWGYDSYSKTVRALNPIKKAEMVYVSNEDCEDQLSKEPELSSHFFIQPDTFCARGRSGENACKGDGGGAMVCEVDRNCKTGDDPYCPSDTRYVIAGIVSWGVSCGEGRPSVFQDVRVAPINNWIRAIFEQYGYQQNH